MREDNIHNIKGGKISNGVKFEEALEKLEDIVRELEGGDLQLDKSLAKYEEGVKLIRICQKKLQEAKKKIEILVTSKEGKVKIEPFGESASGKAEIHGGFASADKEAPKQKKDKK